ncbi:hypothetical protein [Lysobacter antibioticus]|nr:hypothetical protein [Lysobacter antibioticus]
MRSKLDGERGIEGEARRRNVGASGRTAMPCGHRVIGSMEWSGAASDDFAAIEQVRGNRKRYSGTVAATASPDAMATILVKPDS